MMGLYCNGFAQWRTPPLGPPSYGISAPICIGQEKLCLRNAGFFIYTLASLVKRTTVHVTYSCEIPSFRIVKVFFHKNKHIDGFIKTCQWSNKAVQALHFLTVININPGSLNNKIDSFKTYIEEEEVDLACISESHDRGVL